jgi:hypothetical protein
VRSIPDITPSVSRRLTADYQPPPHCTITGPVLFDQKVKLDNGQTIPFDHLVLASGVTQGLLVSMDGEVSSSLANQSPQTQGPSGC